MNTNLNFKEYIGFKLKKNASVFGLDFGKDYNKEGIAKPYFVIPLIAVGVGAAFGISAIKKRLSNIKSNFQEQMQPMQSMKPMQPNNGYFNQDQMNTDIEMNINELKPVSNMISAILTNIDNENYQEFISNYHSINNFFVKVNVEDRDTIFSEIKSYGLNKNLESINEAIIEKDYQTLDVNKYENYEEFMEKLLKPSKEASITLLKIDSKILQKACNQGCKKKTRKIVKKCPVCILKITVVRKNLLNSQIE